MNWLKNFENKRDVFFNMTIFEKVLVLKFNKFLGLVLPVKILTRGNF
jgi:hypothetical protein